MAVLTGVNVFKVWSDGLVDKVSLYAMKKVSTGDTFDLSGDYLSPRTGIMLGTTVTGTAACVISGTVVTMPTGLNNDGAYLLIWGVSN